jgi:demethylmenaquinone methyltransferase/2-methoxy-6-polyprenyl-1,4-benzoquinol methylase
MLRSNDVTNKFYQQGEHRASRVRDLFASVAPRYDLVNDLQSFGLHRYWKERLLRLARVRQGERALDLCCGTGDVAFRLARRGARVVGLDFSGPMLAVALRRAGAAPGPGHDRHNPQFLRGDALEIPFPDDTFDLVTIAYGLRNLAGYEAGLREMWRVTRPGGRLLVLDFGRPDNAVWRWFYFAYLKNLVPVFGRLFCGDPQTHAYILESLRHYPAQHGVAAALRELDCSGLRLVTLLGGAMSIHYGEKLPLVAP